MKIKELKIRWTSHECETETDFDCEITFEPMFRSPESAYREALDAFRQCLAAEGAQFANETVEITEK